MAGARRSEQGKLIVFYLVDKLAVIFKFEINLAEIKTCTGHYYIDISPLWPLVHVVHLAVVLDVEAGGGGGQGEAQHHHPPDVPGPVIPPSCCPPHAAIHIT